MSKYDSVMMNIAIEVALQNIDEGGGPFGAVVVRDGVLVSRSGNSVTIDNDPTAHAEINAIRLASKILGTYDLKGCCLYTTCEPCPMCFGAIYWSRISTVFFALDRDDAARAGFDDKFIYDEINVPFKQRTIVFSKVTHPLSDKIFDKWHCKGDKRLY